MGVGYLHVAQLIGDHSQFLAGAQALMEGAIGSREKLKFVVVVHGGFAKGKILSPTHSLSIESIKQKVILRAAAHSRFLAPKLYPVFPGYCHFI